MLSRMQARGSTPGLERRSWKSRAEEPVGRGPRGGGVRGAGLTPDPLPSAVPLEGPSHAEALSCPRPLPGNLAPGPPAASVAMVTPAQGSPPGPQMLGLISLSASGSGDDGLSEQGWGTSEARLGIWTGLCKASPYGRFQAGCWGLVTGESGPCCCQASGVVGERACVGNGGSPRKRG